MKLLPVTGKPAASMGHLFSTKKIQQRAFLAAVIVALFVLTFASQVHASGYNYHSYNSYDSYPNGYYSHQYPYATNNYQNYTYPYYSGATPSCSISLTSASGYSNYSGYGYPMLLTWSSNNAHGASISPDIGTVALSGSRIVYVTGQQYSMSVYGNGGTSVCQTGSYSVPSYYNYAQPYNYAYAYTAPTYTYAVQPVQISLKQIPYTGVDFGYTGTLLTWLGMILVASFGAATIAQYAGFTEKVLARLRR